jgi:hypothetical protein
VADFLKRIFMDAPIQTPPDTSKYSLTGAVLIVGSLLWENEHNALDQEKGRLRREWRFSSLDITQLRPLKCPIRYGRQSDSRKKTFTMVFSNSCPAKGIGVLVPFRDTTSSTDNYSRLFEFALGLARAEGIASDTQTRLYNDWGAVALCLSPKFEHEKPEFAVALKARWASRFQYLKENDFSIDLTTESPVVKAGGMLNISIDWTQYDQMPDFILATPTVPNKPLYPEPSQIASAMRTAPGTYYTYFIQNVGSGIHTYQDVAIKEALPLDIQATIPLRRRKLRFEDYDPTFGKYYFRSDLIEQLADKLFENSLDKLAKAICSHLDYTTSEPLVTTVSRIIKEFEAYFPADFGDFLDDYGTDPFRRLIGKLLDFQRLPGSEKNRIEIDVLSDLKKREINIAYYEDLPPVNRFRLASKYPDTQEDGMLVDFYKRNIEERARILRYYLFHLKDRAIYNATYHESATLSHLVNNAYFDHPYYSSVPRSELFFDHRRIDKARHRLYQLPIPLAKANELTNIYESNKTLFYDELLKICPPHQAFMDINQAVSFLGAILERRKSLLTELNNLFTHEQWIAFYALALPQIEGIFSDMVAIIAPNKKMGSLLDKVQAARAAYSYATIYFDYFQYQIPIQRNKFMHTGSDEITAQKCFDLLFDIRYLVLAFLELSTPIVEVKNLINSRSIIDFADTEGFNRYFKLLDQMKTAKQYEQLKTEIESFEMDFLSCQTSLEFFASDEFPKALQGAYERWAITVVEFPVDASATVTPVNATLDQIKSNAGNVLYLFEKILFSNYDQLDELLSFNYFLENCHTYIPSMSAAAKSDFQKISAANKTDFERLKTLNRLLENNLKHFRHQ